MTAEEAQEFNRLLAKVTKTNEDLDPSTLKTLRASTKTRNANKVNWYGGGGFTHMVVGASMYEVDDDGGVFLTERATNGEWSKAVAAQLRFHPNARPSGLRRKAGPTAACGD